MSTCHLSKKQDVILIESLRIDVSPSANGVTDRNRLRTTSIRCRYYVAIVVIVVVVVVIVVVYDCRRFLAI
ncbi:unnamed protein product [Onchocerca ochengi]|uniref:Transmembrane protein n=1 Tax=Onchocerca ochengi TaxID=42157 RepID=A0A182E1A8_ONCOC|nr:unnamed protein product [Onchocerca ochengi]